MKVMKYSKKLAPVVAALALAATVVTPASAATLSSISLSPSDSRVSQTSIYTITQSSVTTSNIRCIRVEFDTAADGSGGKPAGMTITGATFNAGSNIVPTPASWSPSNNNGTGVISITEATGETPASASSRTIVLGAITNPSSAGTVYALVNTYNNTDCSTSPVDAGVVAFAITDGTVVSAIVDPTLTFTVSDNAAACNGVSPTANTSGSGTAVSLGRVNTGNLPFRSQNLAVSSNANGGYTVYARYTGQMNDGAGHNIANWTGTNASPTATWAANTEAFGYTSSDATLGTGTANRFTNGGAKFAALSTTDSEVSYAASGPVASDTNCVGYQIGVAGTTRAGSYSTTVVYTAVPVF